MSFNGTLWKTEESPTASDLYDVWVDAGGGVWAAGEDGLLSRDGEQWVNIQALHSSGLRTLTGTGSTPLVAGGVNGTILSLSQGEWSAAIPVPEASWVASCASESGLITFVDSSGTLLHGEPGNWTLEELSEVEELTTCLYDGEALWVGGSGGVIGSKQNNEWNWVSVPELGIRVETLAKVEGVLWTQGTATKILGPFLDYPRWISPATADEPLIGELSWELPGPAP